MLIVGLIESSARFITGLIVFGIVAAFFGWLSHVTGINAFVLIGVVLLVFAIFIFRITGGAKAIKGRKQRKAGAAERRVAAAPTNRCLFIRANGTRCILDQEPDSKYCKHHAGSSPAIEAPTAKPKPRRRSQCGFIKADGSKCKTLKPIEVRRCDLHLNSDMFDKKHT